MDGIVLKGQGQPMETWDKSPAREPHPSGTNKNRTRCSTDQIGCPHDFGGFGCYYGSAVNDSLFQARRIWDMGRQGINGKDMPFYVRNEHRVRSAAYVVPCDMMSPMPQMLLDMHGNTVRHNWRDRIIRGLVIIISRAHRR